MEPWVAASMCFPESRLASAFRITALEEKSLIIRRKPTLGPVPRCGLEEREKAVGWEVLEAGDSGELGQDI